ncbi:MAG: hypothetical protein KDA55_07060 [Planctomycetales bacterium]|nr:hypothetical protein [Planctomycetales bacterium]MCA9208098.1 hypothetical protein [Planctomycetales bacterium]
MGIFERLFGRQSAARNDGGTCDTCGGKLGPLPSLGGMNGGYRCAACGALSCGPCSKSKGLQMNRMTMLCARCGSDATHVTRG